MIPARFRTRFRRPAGGDQAVPAGDRAVPAGDQAVPAGDRAVPAEDRSPGGRAGWRRVAAAAATALATALAGSLVLFALIAPNQLGLLTPAAFLRVPVEGLLGVALLLVLPPRPRRVVAVAAGVVLGLLAILKVIDMGFFAVLAQPFNPVLDWGLLEAAVGFLTESVGGTGAVVAVVAAAVLALAVLILMPLAVLRLTRLVAGHRTAAWRTVTVLGVVWVVSALLGAQIVPGMPVAAHSYGRVLRVSEGLQDRREFALQSAVDAFDDTPAGRLLTGLRGKDVVVTFIESYGRVALTDPRYAARVSQVLADGDRRLRAAGFDSRSGFLTSPTVGGASWLAHATLLSGLWVDNQQRYDTLVGGDRLTLTGAFDRAGWRTVAVMPGITQDWPEADFFGYDRVFDFHTLGYEGPRLNWGTIPDQYAMSVFARAEHTRPDRPPLMAEIALLSSHGPWAPVPALAPDWGSVGDGSGLRPALGAGELSDAAVQDPERMRADYRRAVAYSLRTMISYVETYGDDDLVLVLLGDHQPAPSVTGDAGGRDVPVTIVARDPAVWDRISGWGWQAGLQPGPEAPVWRMDEFRDRFLTAFGPAGPAGAAGAAGAAGG